MPVFAPFPSRRALAGAPVLALFLLTGCPSNGDEADPTPPVAADPDRVGELPMDTAAEGPVHGWSERPQVRVGAQGDTLILFETPEDFPVAFSTYFPEAMSVESVQSDDGNAIRFVADEADWGGEGAVLHAFFPTEEISSEDIRGWVRGVAEDRGEARRAREQRYPWSLLEYRFRDAAGGDATRTGSVVLGRRDPQYYYVVIQSRPQVSEEFRARAEQILDHWLWQDSDEGLEGDDGAEE